MFESIKIPLIMNRLTLLALAILTIFGMAGCSKDNEDLEQLILRQIKGNTYPGEKIEIGEICQPDSTFGVMYLPEKEILNITKMTDNVTEFFMKKTNNMQKYDPNDGYMAYLANKQMLVAAEINEIIAHSMQKKEFNGWFVRVTYAVTNKSGKRKNVEYFFLDKEKSFIYNSFSVPLP